eukprot:Phypoly_transcript_02349.p1 GENE.Phypoly_transcript_02349~~Phypoly_transcript_02349.p1  ORF type:complete len:925 (+),score=149.69 Phypoly_transcript_02349:366-2777(+)
MNHIAIWKSLLASLGIEMPDPASHAFAFNANLWDSSFTVGTIQLALGTLTSAYFPEVLGYNMGFEQLPLHLLTTVDELRKLEIDPYYFQLHISIDNLASGHGAMAVQAVKIYLDDVRTRLGEAIAEKHWRRVLDGFYLNEISPMKPELEKFYKSKREGSLQEKMIHMLRKKAPFAHQLHGTREVGGCLLNKWLDPSASDDQLREFLDTLYSSHWISPENPANSRFLTDLCGFGGPMFHIFTRDELQLISDWAQSLSPTTPISPPPKTHNPTAKDHPTPASPQPASHAADDLQVAQAMADLMTKKAERAKRAHGNRTMANAKGEAKKINDWFACDSAWELLDALRHTYRLDMVTSKRGDTPPEAAVDANPFVKSIASGGMAKYFDKEEVEVVRKWILAGAPIPPPATPATSPITSSTIPSNAPSHTPSQISTEIPPSMPTTATSETTPKKHTLISPTNPHTSAIESPTPIYEISPQTTRPQQKINNTAAKFECPFLAKSKPTADSRDSFDSLFFRLMNVEAHPEAFGEAKRFLSSCFIYDHNENNSAPLDEQSESCLNDLSSLIFSCDSLASLTVLAKHASLLFFVEGISLQNVNMAGFHHTYLNSVLMKIFMNIWGYDQPLANHHHFFNNLLKNLRVYLPPLNSSFVSKCGFKSSTTEFAILQLSLSLLPRSFFIEMLAVLEWSLVMNKMILEGLTKRIQNFGVFAYDSKMAQARIEEYTRNIALCREVIQLQMDDTRAQGALAECAARFGKGRSLCRKLTNEFLRQVGPEVGPQSANAQGELSKSFTAIELGIPQSVGCGSS